MAAWLRYGGGFAVLALAFLVPVLLPHELYLIHILTLTCLYAIPAVGLNLMLGYAGLISLGHAAFVGIGGYTAAILMVDLGLGFWPAMAVASFAAGVAGVLIGIPALRLRGHSFIIATLAFGMVLFTIMNNWDSVTRGAQGFVGIPRPDPITVFGRGLEFKALPDFYRLVLILTGIVFALQRLVVHSNFGRILTAIRQDETLAAFKGVDTMRYKLAVFALGSAIAGVGGALSVSFLRVASPLSFELLESINYCLVVIVGGAGFLAGPILGAAAFIGIPEYFRAARELRLVLFGLVLVLMTLFARKGIAGLIRQAGASLTRTR